MGIIDNILEREIQIVDLDGTEKTWIGGVYCPPMWRGDEGSYLFVRCVRKEDVINKEVKTVKLKETNRCWTIRHWTNLPEVWDNKAMVVDEAPETLWEYEHYHDVFEHEYILLDWLDEDAHNYWDDGFTEWEDGEFEEKCDEYVERSREECKEIPFEEWIKKPVITREEWLKR